MYVYAYIQTAVTHHFANESLNCELRVSESWPGCVTRADKTNSDIPWTK